MNKFFNEVSTRYLSSVVIESNQIIENKEELISYFEVSMLNMDIAQYGYTFGMDVLEKLHTMSKEEVNSFAETLNKVMEEFKRTDIKAVPLFKRFPYNLDVNETKYLKNRIIGFEENFQRRILNEENQKNSYQMLSCGHLINTNVFDLREFGACPICQYKVVELDTVPKNMPPLINTTPLIILTLSTSKDVFAVFKNMMDSKLAYSPDFKKTIDGFFEHFGSNIKGLLPKEIIIKENAAYITSKIFEVDSKKPIILAKNYIKTATDVLRLAVAFSGGDISLAENTKFKLTNKQRHFIMSLLDNVSSSLEEDLLRNKEGWLRLSRTLHVGSFSKKYPTAFSAIDKLRNNAREIKTFNSSFEAAMLANKYDDSALLDVLEIVMGRPGVFARNLDCLLRTNQREQYFILEQFKKIIKDVSTNVLLSVYKHMSERNNLKERIFIPKGNSLNVAFGSKPMGSFSINVIMEIKEMIMIEVQSRFNKKEFYENVYIDPSIENLIVPFAMRANSLDSLNMTRGSRIKIADETDVVGLFINWHDNETECKRIDLDLSAVFLNEDFKKVSSVSYQGYSSEKTGAYYSGDIQSGKGKHGGYEGINIDLKSRGIKLNMDNGARYVAMSVIVYAGTSFNTFNAVAGYQEREKLKGGSALEASKVKTKFQISGSGRSCLPLLFDLKTREIIWVDAHMKSNNLRFKNIETEAKSIGNIVKAFVQLKDYKLSMKELMDFHSGRFGQIDTVKVPDKNYDLIIDQDFALNLPEVVSKWL